jgi:hypothetical protein
MLRRLLNIASIVCLVFYVGLIGMWVRSLYWIDELRGRFVGPQECVLTSRPGRLLVTYIQMSANTPVLAKRETSSWSLNSERYGPDFQPEQLQAPWLCPAFRVLHPAALPGLSSRRPKTWGLVLSYWFLAVVSVALAMVFRLRWPFAVHSPKPVHCHHIPIHRAGNDRLARPRVDREVTRIVGC